MDAYASGVLGGLEVCRSWRQKEDGAHLSPKYALIV